MEKDPEAGRDFAGYGVVAEAFKNDLEEVYQADGLKSVQIRMKPKPDLGGKSVGDMSEAEQLAALRAGKRQQLYDDEGLPASQALRLLAYKMTNAIEIVEAVDEETQEGDVILHGLYNGKHLYFIEHYESDELGRYITCTLMNEMPWGLVPKQPKTESKERPFVTTSQEMELREEFKITEKEIEAIAVAEVDEAQIVRDYFDNRQAA
jgi:hypothetical protein